MVEKQVFGRKTEKTSAIMDGGTQFSLFQKGNEQAVSIPETTITVPEHKRKAKRTHEEWMSGLEVEEKIHEIKNPVCDKCGAKMAEIGSAKAYDELVYTSAKFHIRRHIVKSYKCIKCGTNSENDAQNSDEIERCNIRRVDYPKPMISHSFCSLELAAHIIYEKFAKVVRCIGRKSILYLRASRFSEPLCLNGLTLTQSNGVCRSCRKCMNF